MLTIDTTRPLKRHTQLQDLVEAVFKAQPHDELDWVEWKACIDLGDHEGQGTVARHILGMANRDPDAAARTTAGYGYLLVGVEPGSCPGIPPVDPADLEPRIQQFLSGQDGPTWQALWVSTGTYNACVLIIIVDPPCQGDPIHTLEKQFGKYSSGEVFVRRLGRTEKARPEDIRRLTARAHGDTIGRLTVEVTTPDAAPPHITAIDLSDEALRPWVEHEKRILLASLESNLPEAEGAGRTQPAAWGVQREVVRMAAITKGLAAKLIRDEARTPEEYLQEVDDYLQRSSEAAIAVARARHIEQRLARIQLVLVNPTDHPFRDVQVVLFIPGDGVAGFDGAPYVENLPARPRPWGPRFMYGEGHPSFPHIDIPGAISAYGSPLITRGPSVEIDNSGSTRFRFPVVSVGPQDCETLASVDLLVAPEYAGKQITGDWEARSTHVSGVVREKLIISVEAASMPAHALLPEPASDHS